MLMMESYINVIQRVQGDASDHFNQILLEITKKGSCLNRILKHIMQYARKEYTILC